MTNYYINLTSSANIQSNSSGVISANGFTNPQIYVNGVSGNTLSANTWSLVTVTSDTAINADQFYVGRIGSNYYDGTLDEVRLYNRALITPSEVQKLYNWAPGPVGYWKFDENTGTSYTYDTSGNGNTGTLVNGPTWAPGKYGSALNFDGNAAADDYVYASPNSTINNLTAMTFSAWIYPRGLGEGGSGRIFAKCPDTANCRTLSMYTNNSVAFIYGWSASTGQFVLWNTPNNSINLNRWNHVEVTYDKSSTGNDPDNLYKWDKAVAHRINVTKWYCC